MKDLEKIITRTLCFIHKGILSSYYIFNNDTYFCRFSSTKILFYLFFFTLNPFQHQQALHFRVLNYEKQHKEGTCKISARSYIFLAFYADFCFCPKSVNITILSHMQVGTQLIQYIFTYLSRFTSTKCPY